MRFGAFVPQGWRLDLAGIEPERHWEAMAGVARAIESSGYESLWVYDHFHTVPEPTQEATYEAWTLMASLAVATETIRLGQMCTCNSYRNPAYLAKVAASIDVISGGRLEMGIGAGWYEHEYRGYGYRFAKASVRIARLREAVEIMRRLWTEDEVHHRGDHYRLEGAICRPKPLQDPHVPLWVAGGGERLTLNVAARYASHTNFGQDLEEFVHKSEVLAEHCREVGTDYEAIARSSNFNVICEETEGEVEERMAWIADRHRPYVSGDPLERVRKLYGPTAGTPEQLAETFRPWSEAGLDYAICYFAGTAHDTAGLERFAREVVPALS